MTARAKIFSAIRDGLATPRQSPDVIAAAAAALLNAPDTTRPRLVAETLPDSFAVKALALGTTLDYVTSMADVPRAVRRYLDGHTLPFSVALQSVPEFMGLNWSQLHPHNKLASDETAAVGLAEWGIAESGSLVVHSGQNTPIMLSFLPMHHIIVLRENTILPYLEDYAATLSGSAIPRNVVLITGPSGTTDIEGSYVRGAHGPGFLHVIILVVDPDDRGAGI